MANLTLAQARKMLPAFARGLGIYARSVGVLRDAVMQELEAANTGDNPLTEKQIKQLQSFLQKTE